MICYFNIYFQINLKIQFSLFLGWVLDLSSVLSCFYTVFLLFLRPMIQEKMNVLEQVGLSESNISEKAECASFHSKVSMQSFYHLHLTSERLKINHVQPARKNNCRLPLHFYLFVSFIISLNVESFRTYFAFRIHLNKF